MRIGYACLALGVQGTSLKTCLIRDADEARLHALIVSNLAALDSMVAYNVKNGILLYRISSDIIPFASSPVNQIPWWDTYGDTLARIGSVIKGSGMRVSMHPGQYTVLNSPNRTTYENAVRELAYHARFLDSLGVEDSCKIVLHVGGVYGDKLQAVRQFETGYAALDVRVKARLVIENDDKCYHAADVLALGLALGIPAVYDNLHNMANPSPQQLSDRAWVTKFAGTWQPEDGAQKIHYSQPDPSKRMGAHSPYIALDPFLAFYNSLDTPAPDMMLEVKDKNISALKCLLALKTPGDIGALEREWGRWKYLVLERSQNTYRDIRELLKDKTNCSPADFFRLVELALSNPIDRGSAINALQHIWGYVNDTASPAQRRFFLTRLEAYARGIGSLGPLKRKLYALSLQAQQQYLLESYYFVPQYAGEEGTQA